jgi:hypothetical protein
MATHPAILSVRDALVGQAAPTLAAEYLRWFAQSEVLLGQIALLVQRGLEQLPSVDPQTLAAALVDKVRESLVRAQPTLAPWFVANNQLLQLVAKVLAARAARERAAGALPEHAQVIDVPSQEPPLVDIRTPAQRERANLRAIELVMRGAVLTDAERREVMAYSGWGALSLTNLPDKLARIIAQSGATESAADWLPETRSLIAEYYTPWEIVRAAAELLRPRIQSLGVSAGMLVALEPAAGSGRFVEALIGSGFERLRWHLCEISQVAGRMLQALYPSADVSIGPFEQWVKDHPALSGKVDLVVANPPYGERGAASVIDTDKAYRALDAADYFLMRSLDFLAPGGLGLYVIPWGFLSDKGNAAEARRKAVLSRHHLEVAFRLPSEDEKGSPTFSGVRYVTDLCLFRARGGSLAQTDAADESIAQGRYFDEFPAHLLGRQDMRPGAMGALRYAVVGTFTGLPKFAARPLCASFVLTQPQVTPAPQPVTDDQPDAVKQALALARWTSRFLTLLSSGTAESMQKAALQFPDLHLALKAWFAQPAEERAPIIGAQKRVPELRALLAAQQGGELLPALSTPPKYKPAFPGKPDAVVEQAQFLYGAERQLSVGRLEEFHKSLGGMLATKSLTDQLLAVGWAVDGALTRNDAILADAVLLPEQDYYSGWLWQRHDRIKPLAEQGHPYAVTQLRRLLQNIQPATWSELRVEPRLGWIPVTVLQDFANSFLARRDNDIRLRRVGSMLLGKTTSTKVEPLTYGDIEDTMGSHFEDFIGYLNHDLHLFRPKVRVSEGETLEKNRILYDERVREAFELFLDTKPEHQQAIVDAHNHFFRGWVAPAYAEAPLQITRWAEDAPLHSYQNAAVRRLAANHGGGLFYDVGLGKTRVVLATIALAKEQGWASRPVVVVPNSIIWKWVEEIAQVLPNFRVVVIGSAKKHLTRGERKGEEVGDTDTPAERSVKWQRFKAGLYDMALLTYSSLERTRMDVKVLSEVVRGMPALMRQITLTARDDGAKLDAIAQKLRYRGQLTEREKKFLAAEEELRSRLEGVPKSERKRAIEEERVERYIAEICDLGERAPDPGVAWEEIGIDFLAFDEGHTGKNLWTAAEREGGALAFLSSPTEPSRIALQMMLRAALVRKRTGGSGILLATATPAKNSPLEFAATYSILDGGFWSALGIGDIEQFITQYLKIERRLVTRASLEITEASCVTGFKNMGQLRSVLHRLGEYRTAKQVGLKLPEIDPQVIKVELNEYQEFKYRHYLSQVQDALSKDGARTQALGLMARMSLVAVHPDLDGKRFKYGGVLVPRTGTAEMLKAVRTAHLEKWQGIPSAPDIEVTEVAEPWNAGNALQHPEPSCPKFEEITRCVLSQAGCGYLIFLENIVAHYWLREVLVKAGVPRERIALLNGVEAKDPVTRQRIARGFSEERRYDVVIANAVAYEGVDLQRHTCMIIHGDLPWEPATLQQRNGRAYRQGNTNSVLHLVYILSDRSTDLRRFALIQGKRGWLVDLLESQDSEINNPGAQADLSPEEWLLFLSRDESMTKKLIGQRKAESDTQARQKLRREAWLKVRAIAARHRDFLTADEVTQARLQQEMNAFVAECRSYDPAVWPWLFIAEKAAKVPTLALAPKVSGAIPEGAVFRSDTQKIEYGRVSWAPIKGIWQRNLGSSLWMLTRAEFNERFLSDDETEACWTGPPPDEAAEEAVRRAIDLCRKLQRDRPLREMNLGRASSRFRALGWKQYGEDVVRVLAELPGGNLQLPIVMPSGAVVLATGAKIQQGRVLPWTDEGFSECMQLARRADPLTQQQLAEGVEDWFGERLRIPTPTGRQSP